MSKQHCIVIAATFNEQMQAVNIAQALTVPGSSGDHAREAQKTVLRATANKLADGFAQFNVNFDRQRFLRACGVA